MKVKSLSVLTIPLLLAGFFAGCTGKSNQASSPTALSETGTGLCIKYAKNFNIDYQSGGVKLVTDSDGKRLLLVPKGQNAPPGYGNAVLVETPVAKAMYTSTAFVGFLDALEDDSVFDSVVAVTAPKEDWYIPRVRDRFERGLTRYIGRNAVGYIEEIVKIKPDIVFTLGEYEADMPLRNMLDAVDIKHATLLQYTEEGHAANLEWIKFFAAFFNLDEEADRIFNAKLARLDELYEKAAAVSDRPTAAFALISNGKIYSQPGNSAIARQIEMAGGIYAFKDLKGSRSVPITMENFLNWCRDTDVIILGWMVQYFSDKSFLLSQEPLMAEFSAFKNDKIYVFNRDYYQNSAKVVEKFEDIVFMLQPDLFPGHKLSMHRKLTD